MIQMRTWLTVADNSGARKLTCIMPVGGDAGLKAGLGDVITAAVKEATPESQVKKGSVVKAVVVRMRKERRRKDGTYIRFDDNAAVLINDANVRVVCGSCGKHTRIGHTILPDGTKVRSCRHCNTTLDK